MGSKAVSEYYRPSSPLYGKELRVDIDRLISYLSIEISNTRNYLENPEGTLYEDKGISKEMGLYLDNLEGLLNLILANEFQ